MSERLAQARAEAERQFPDGESMARGQDRIIFTKGWHAADANPQPLPRPGDGCQCTGYSQDAGGGYFEYLVEYEPACPEHSEHVYNPRTGVWEHANPQPRTITRDDLDRMAVQISHDMPDEPMWSCVVVARNALKALGIEVEDDYE